MRSVGQTAPGDGRVGEAQGLRSEASPKQSLSRSRLLGSQLHRFGLGHQEQARPCPQRQPLYHRLSSHLPQSGHFYLALTAPLRSVFRVVEGFGYTSSEHGPINSRAVSWARFVNRKQGWLSVQSGPVEELVTSGGGDELEAENRCLDWAGPDRGDGAVSAMGPGVQIFWLPIQAPDIFLDLATSRSARNSRPRGTAHGRL